MNEIWKPIEENDLYSVSNLGRIRNNQTQHVRDFQNQRDINRYAVFCFKKHGKRINKKVHRLVADAFIPNIDNKPEINHISGDKFDNCVENLEWCTHSENMKHAYRTGICPPLPSQKTTLVAFNEDETKVVGLYHSIVEAAQQTGISINTLYATVTTRNRNPVHGRIWFKVGRDVSLTTSENKTDNKESVGNE